MLRALLLMLCLAGGLAHAADADTEARFVRITERLRCLVCQNQSIAESHAELAVDLKRQVREMMAAGRSDADIADYMVQRYGDFVLYEPPIKTSTLLLWGGPAALLLLALGGFAWTVRARAKNAPDEGLSAEQRAAARALLAGSPASDNQENKA